MGFWSKFFDVVECADWVTPLAGIVRTSDPNSVWSQATNCTVNDVKKMLKKKGVEPLSVYYGGDVIHFCIKKSDEWKLL